MTTAYRVCHWERVSSYCDNDAGYCRDEPVYRGLDLSKNEADDVTHCATHQTLTSSTAETSHYDDSAHKSPKLRRFCLPRDDRLSLTSGPCRRLGLSSSCAGHVVSLRSCGDESGGNDVTVSSPTPHDRISLSVAGCRSLPTGLPLYVKPDLPNLIQSQGVHASSPRVPSTTTAAAAAAAFQHRLLLEALRSPSMHGYTDTAACDRNATVSDLGVAPSANYAVASAAAVLSTQLAIHAWFRKALDSRTSPLRLVADLSRMPPPGYDWMQRPPKATLPLTLRDVEANASSLYRPVDDKEDEVCDVASQLDEISRPASELSHSEQRANELDEDQL